VSFCSSSGFVVFRSSTCSPFSRSSSETGFRLLLLRRLLHPEEVHSCRQDELAKMSW